MNRLIKKLIIALIVVCTMSPISLAANITNQNGKGTVTVEKPDKDYGTEENPYQLVIGESLIDIYYEKDKEKRGFLTKDQYFYFQFTNGSYNAANYLVDHNKDKQRIRFTLIGTDESSLRVSASEGLNYLQAGAITYAPDYIENDNIEIEENEVTDPEELNKDALDVQIPFYNIEATESFSAVRDKLNIGINSTSLIEEDKNVTLQNRVDLGNGYLTSTENTLAANVSNYAISYIFSKSGLPFDTAYNLTDEQVEKAKYNMEFYGRSEDYRSEFNDSAYTKFSGDKRLVETTIRTGAREGYRYTYSNFGSVNVKYYFKGTSSELASPLEEEANSLEKLITKIFISIGDVFVKVSGLNSKVGEEATTKNAYVTIDSLIFNEYPNTIVDFFGDVGYTNKTAKGVIEFWFNVFKVWSIIIYIILLIYIGVKTVLVSGTSEQKKVKGMLEGWLTGLLLLFFLPFLFKYLIVINDTLVDIIRVNSKYSVHAYYTFEDMYERLGGQEDGEDSTTTILEKLKDESDFLKEERAKIEAKKESLMTRIEHAKKELGNLYNDTLDSNYEERLNVVIEGVRNEIDGFLKGHNLNSTGQQIENDLMRLILPQFFANEENKEAFINGGNAILANNPKLRIEIMKYCDSINNGIMDSNVKGQLVDKIYNFTRHIISRDYYHLVYENMKKQEEGVAEEIAQIEQEIANIEDAILMLENNDADIMGAMRTNAGETGRFFYVVIWYIILFETILLLVLYYKRLFMLMALIAIFPLITIAYVYEKSKGGKSTILKNWIQEYVVNVFIQSIHAILYVTLVEAGYTVYIADNDNWVIFIMAVVALIMVEPVFKHILGLKSSTVTDLAKYGASAAKTLAVAGAVGSTIAHTRQDLKNIDNAAKNKEAQIKKKQKEDDKRQNTLRQHRDNKINSNQKLSQQEKQDKLDKKHERDKKADKRKEWLRKKEAKARVHRRRLQRLNRLGKNTAALRMAVVGGLAAGGQMDDFITAASVGNALSGTGGKVKLSEDAEKLENANVNVNSGNTEGNSSQTSTIPDNINYSGDSYDEYGFGDFGTSSGGPIIEGGAVESSKLASTFAQRLDEEKIYVNKKYNITEED